VARQHRRAWPRDPGYARHAAGSRRRPAASLADVLRDPAYIAEIRKVNLAAGFAGADEVRAAVEKAMTTLDEKGLAEMREIAARALLMSS